jgi:AraC family transcriptional regulator
MRAVAERLPFRLALRGTLPQPLFSSRSLSWTAVTIEFYRTRGIEVIGQCSHHTISVMTGGCFDLYQRRNGGELRATMHPGDIIITSAGPPKHWQHAGEAEYIVARIPPSFLQRIFDDGGSLNRAYPELRDSFQTRDPEIERLAKRMLAEAANVAFASRTYFDALATELGINLLRNYCTTRRAATDRTQGMPAYKLRRAAEFIEANLREDLTLDRVSEVLAMSPGHFAHTFKKTTGLAPHQYLVERRIDRSKDLLRRTSLPIAEIAHRVGYRSHCHFSVAFRHATGVTPRQYRSGS